MAFVAIIALINGIIGGIGGWFGFANTSGKYFGYVGWHSLAWIMVWTGVMQILPEV